MPAKINFNHCRFRVSPLGPGADMISEVTFFIPQAHIPEIIALHDEKGYTVGEATGFVLKPMISTVIGPNVLYAYQLFDCVDDQKIDTGTFDTHD